MDKQENTKEYSPDELDEFFIKKYLELFYTKNINSLYNELEKLVEILTVDCNDYYKKRLKCFGIHEIAKILIKNQ